VESPDTRTCGTTGGEATSVAERPAWGDEGRAGGKTGLVTESHTAGDEHLILVEREPLCRKRCEAVRGPCQGTELDISDGAVVLRASGNEARPASHNDFGMD